MNLLPRSRCGIWLLATAAWGIGCALVWGALPFVPRGKWLPPENHTRCQLLDDGHTIVTARPGDGPNFWQAYQGLLFWNPDTNRVREPLGRRKLTVHAVSSDGRWIAFVPTEDPTQVVLFDHVSGQTLPLSRPDLPLPSSCQQLEFLPGGRALAAEYLFGRSDSYVQMWEIPSRRKYDLPRGVQSLNGCSLDGRWVALSWPAPSSNGYEYLVWDVDRREVRNAFHADTHAHVEFMPDGEGLLACSPSGRPPWVEMRYWDLHGHERWAVKDVLGGPIICANRLWPAQPEDWVGKHGIFMGNDFRGRPVRFFDTANGQIRQELKLEDLDFYHGTSPDGAIVAVQVSRDWSESPIGRLLDFLHLSGVMRVQADDVLDLRNSATGHSIAELPLPSARVQVEFSANGRVLAVYDDEDHDSVTLWDIPPRKQLTWFSLAASILVPPFVWLAHCRLRRLRREAG